MERGDIYRVSLDPTSGREQAGHRPVLIISPGAFNKATGAPICLPIATVGNLARSLGFDVNLSGAGTKTTGVVLCDQLRALDLRARAAKKVERAPDFIIEEVLARLAPIFE